MTTIQKVKRHAVDLELELLRLECEATAKKNGITVVDSSAFNALDGVIGVALEKCKNARLLIPSEQEKIRPLILEAKNEVEKAFREYQFNLVALQLNRAADAAENRLRLFESLKSEGDCEAEKQKCAEGQTGTLYWFENYAWTFDPRETSPISVIPLIVFPFQTEYIRWLEMLTFLRRSSGLVEKCRDAGATEVTLRWVNKQWLFRPDFSAMILSRKEDMTDSKKNMDTLFEKVRFQMRLTPSWMMPEGFDTSRDMPYMNISNPQNGSSITGEAPTEDVARGGRRSFILSDEYATWQFGGYPQYKALSSTAQTTIFLATPKGKFNKYADLKFDNLIPRFVMDWREHPWKTEAWYKALPFGYGSPPMSAEEIAQEIDRDFEASQPGRVFRFFSEPHMFITWAELVAYYDQFKLGFKFRKSDGTYRIPDDWNWGRMQDRGESEEHPRVTSWMARPAAYYPLSDTAFFVAEMIAPTGAPLGQVANLMEEVERRFGLSDRRPTLSKNSHEASDERDVFRKEHGINFTTWNTDYVTGIAQLKEWFMLIDTEKPNPIRSGIFGRTRIIFICANEQAKLFYDDKNTKHIVSPPSSSAGFKRARYEFPLYHYPPEERGKPLHKMRPEKIDDDFIDTARAFAVEWGPSAKPLTKQQKREQELPPELRADKVAQMSAEEQERAILARQYAMNEMKVAEDSSKPRRVGIRPGGVGFRR